jgi:hypothetical protein
MATTDTVCFGDADGVTGIPQINGMVDYDYLPFDPADPFETGYVKGSRITYEGGALASAMFQGVRYSGTHLAFGFLARLDNHFDEEDVIILALRQSPASGPAKLVAIYPNLDGVGAEPGVSSCTVKPNGSIPAGRSRIARPRTWFAKVCARVRCGPARRCSMPRRATRASHTR